MSCRETRASRSRVDQTSARWICSLHTDSRVRGDNGPKAASKSWQRGVGPATPNRVALSRFTHAPPTPAQPVVCFDSNSTPPCHCLQPGVKCLHNWPQNSFAPSMLGNQLRRARIRSSGQPLSCLSVLRRTSNTQLSPIPCV